MRVDEVTMSREAFIRVLYEWNSPLMPWAGEVYDYAVDGHPVNPAYVLAIARKETQMGTTGVGAKQNNLFGLGDHFSWPKPGRWYDGPGNFAYYYDARHSAYDFIDLIRGTGPAPDFYYPSGNYTVEDIAYVYAPADENDTAKYVAQVEDWIIEWSDLEPGPEPVGIGDKIRAWLTEIMDIRAALNLVQEGLEDVLENYLEELE